MSFAPDCNTERCVISSSSFYPDPLRAGASEPHNEDGERGEAHAHLIRGLLQTSPQLKSFVVVEGDGPKEPNYGGAKNKICAGRPWDLLF